MMMGRQTGLGRGLGALIPQRPPSSAPVKEPVADDTQEPGMAIRKIGVDLIEPNPHQPRSHFEHGALEDLVGSIKEHGILQPLVVTMKMDGRYELIAGERRLRAAKIAGFDTVPAIVRTATEQQKMELALIENVQRADLNPIEEAHAYLRLQEEFGLTQDEVGVRVGKSRPQVGNTIRLLQLPDEIQRALMEGKISASNARTLLSIPTDDERMRMFDAMLKGNFTVRQTEARILPGRRRRSTETDPNLSALEDRFRVALGTQVKVTRDARGEGEVRIRYYNDEDLKGIAEKIAGEEEE
ncbi:ParB/RepB/Spo0J family partition protein [Patescibacteria group bacterium]|nr:ParB/RepB/Spo0J family partition protein [Patescibacteria group bacterium]